MFNRRADLLMQETPSASSCSDHSLDDCLQQMSSELDMDHFLKNIEQLGGQTARRNQEANRESRKEQLLKANLGRLKDKGREFSEILAEKRRAKREEEKVEFDTVGMRTEEIRDLKQLGRGAESRGVMEYLQSLNRDLARKIKEAEHRPEPKMRRHEFRSFYSRVQRNQDRSRSRLEDKRRKWKGHESREETFRPKLNRRETRRGGEWSASQAKRNLAQKLMREDSLDKFEECTVRSRSVSVKDSAKLRPETERQMQRMQRQTREIMQKKRRKQVENEQARRREEDRKFEAYCTFRPRVNGKKRRAPTPNSGALSSTTDRLYEWKKKNDQKLEEERKKKEKKFQKEHTFKPKLAKSVYTDRIFADRDFEKVGDRLYNDHKLKMRRKSQAGVPSRPRKKTRPKPKELVPAKAGLGSDSGQAEAEDKGNSRVKAKGLELKRNAEEPETEKQPELSRTMESRRRLTAYRSDFEKGRAVRNGESPGRSSERVGLSRRFNKNKADKLRETIELLNENWEEVEKDTREMQQRQVQARKGGYGEMYQQRKTGPGQSLNLLKKKRRKKEARKPKRADSTRRVTLEAEVSYEEGIALYAVSVTPREEPGTEEAGDHAARECGRLEESEQQRRPFPAEPPEAPAVQAGTGREPLEQRVRGTEGAPRPGAAKAPGRDRLQPNSRAFPEEKTGGPVHKKRRQLVELELGRKADRGLRPLPREIRVECRGGAPQEAEEVQAFRFERGSE